MLTLSMQARINASRAASTVSRRLLAKASSTLPARQSVVCNAQVPLPTARASATPPATGGVHETKFDRRTHRGSATATSSEATADGSSSSAFPQLLHALDTHQPLADPDPSLSMGNTAPAWLARRDTHADPASSVVRLSVNDTDRLLNVWWADGHASQYHLIWLRDHDYSDVNETNQRSTDTFSIPLDISARGVELSPCGRLLQVDR